MEENGELLLALPGESGLRVNGVISVIAMKKQEGLTFVEIIMTIVIISGVVLFILYFYGQYTRSVHHTEKTSQALKIAEITMEEMKGQAYTDWDDFINDYDSFDINSSIFDSLELVTEGYSVEVELSQMDLDGDGVYDPDVRKIGVTVSWDNEERDVELESIIFRR